MTATFGLQGDALLQDVRNARLSGVVRVIGTSLIVKMVKKGRCRLRHMLEAVAGFLVEHRTGSAERATALTSVGKEPTALERAAAAGSVAKHRFRKREGERWRRLAALLQDSR